MSEYMLGPFKMDGNWIVRANGHLTTPITNPELDKANAAFIVRACNAHAELVRALGWARNCLEDFMLKLQYQAIDQIPIIQAIDEALAKAKGDQDV